MLSSYNSFKKKIKTEFLIKTIILSVSIFLLAFGTLFILYKTKVISLNPLISLGIGFGLGILVFLAVFFIFKPKDIKIAKRIDKTFNLGEKTETMIIYQNSDEPMATLQREDTLERLDNIGVKSLKMRIHWLLYVLLAFGLVATITGVSIPRHVDAQTEEEDPEKPYTLTEWQIAQLNQLIQYVNKSKMNNEMKGGYTLQLSMLIEHLEASTKESQMKQYVNVAILNILALMERANTNKECYSLLKSTEIEKLELLGESIKDYNTTDVSDVLLAIQKDYQANYDSDLAGFMTRLDSEIDALKKAVDETELSKDDAFYLAVNQYYTDMYKTKSVSTLKIMSTIQDAINSFESTLLVVVSDKLENRTVAWYVEDNLRELFGLEKADRAEGGSSSGTGGDSDAGSQEGTGEGGMGHGDYIFGSDDVLYDYDNNKLVPYGELYDTYYAVLNGLINDGSLSEEMIEYINAYLESLTKTNKGE